MSTEGQVVRYERHSRRRKEMPDLNAPPAENMYQQGGPGLSLLADLGVQANVQVVHGGQVHQPAGSTHPAPIDVEELDDDVVIASPTAFEEAKKRRLVIDVDAHDASRLGRNAVNKRRRRHPNAPSIDCELYVSLEGSSGSMRVAPPPPPPLPEPTFTCLVCMGPLVEEMTTKCGHIFCKVCITAAIKAQHKCPSCRRKLTVKNLIRVYLPTTK
ncbi:uncharacterized protein LOC143537444 [Bidens hawaiensis]|uniref:uncharacterized protein LOC143537444 n=1 Tax=Bidens hawaiensis TaxID=980011 RepID=UPI00404AD9F8